MQIKKLLELLEEFKGYSICYAFFSISVNTSSITIHNNPQLISDKKLVSKLISQIKALSKRPLSKVYMYNGSSEDIIRILKYEDTIYFLTK